jgi:hypothetical protein
MLPPSCLRFSRSRRTFLLGAAAIALLSGSILAWGPMHAPITEAAFDALPEWQRELFAAQRQTLIDFDCIIPDLARAPAHRQTIGRFATLPNGDPFTHEPHRRHHNFDQMLHYFSQAVEQIRASQLDEASRYAGCLLHFLEDCGSPAHSIPGDNQHGLMKDLLVVPEIYRDRPLHSLIESGQLKLDLVGYHPQLLGTTPQEAVFQLVERLNFAVRNARAQVIPILQGVFADDQAAMDAGRRRAATVDAQISADALYTICCIAKNRFDDAEKARLETVDVVALTPLEVISQAYFPQDTYYSNPFFGYPTPNGILKDGTAKQPLVLKVMENGATAARTFARGFGLGTHSRLTYSLPAKVYDRLECWVGLHAPLGAEGSVAFRVYADGEAVFDSGVLTGADPARKVTLPLWRVQELSFDVEARGTPAGKNYAVLAEPTLFKAKAPPKLDFPGVP